MALINEVKSDLKSALKPANLIVMGIVIVGILWAVKFVGSKVPAVQKIDPTR